MPLHPLTNLEIQKYYQNEPKFNEFYLCDNLLDKVKDGAYVINLYEYADSGTQRIALYVDDNVVICFDSLESNTFQEK